jgi:hypothetical protein
MNLWRMIVGSTVRAVVYRLVGLAFVVGAALLSGKAKAATYTYPDQGAAFAGCQAQGASIYPYDLTGGTTERRFHDCLLSGNGYFLRYSNCPKGGTGTTGCGAAGSTSEYHTWVPGATCTSRGSSTHNAPPFPTSGSGLAYQSGALDCSSGCVRSSTANGDGTWTYTFGQNTTCTVESLADDCEALGMVPVFYGCQPPKPECESNQSKSPVTGKCVDVCPAGMHLDEDGGCAPDKESCPAGEIRSPAGTCLPGDGMCAVGEAKRPNGTCGKDSDGDGVADDDDEDPENDSEKETFSGGDNCSSPPSCSGGPIMCGQARIQWRIDCNTRRNVNISGGSCGAVPVCTGETCNAMEYAQLLQQWKAGCELERLNANIGEGGEGDNSDIIEALTGPGAGHVPDQAGTAGMPDDGGLGQGEPEEFEPDDSGFGWGGGSCPTIPAINVMGQSVSFDLQPMCQWFQLGGMFVLLLAGLASMKIAATGSAK